VTPDRSRDDRAEARRSKDDQEGHDRPKGDRAAVFIVRDGRLLVFHRRKGGETYDAIPGGTLEAGETPAEAAVREIHEETGLRVTLSGPVLELHNQGRRETYFDALTVTGEPRLGGPEKWRNSPENAYTLDWVPLAGIGSRPIQPGALRRWLSGRDWSRLGG
jgi:8-oxo-dGTP diphosphatase